MTHVLLGEKLVELDKRLVRCCLRKGGNTSFRGCESAKKNRGDQGDFFQEFQEFLEAIMEVKVVGK